MDTTRRGVTGALVLAAVLLATALPAGATAPDAGDDTGPGPSTRIVGGTTAPPGTWPSQVALLASVQPNNYQAQFCGGTVIDPSWILTAAHCLRGKAAFQVDVLIGTHSLVSGGTRHRAAELRMFPYYDHDRYNGDYGLIRIGTPTSAPLQAIPTQGAGVAAGTTAVTTGWGTMSSGVDDFPTLLQQVTVPIISNATCAASYPGAISWMMLCAGQAPYHSFDACQGDSGGPLVVPQGGRWVQVGITSWGYGCADGAPGVYARVAAQADWIRSQVRFGPHSSPHAFVRATWLDLYGAHPSGAALFTGVAAQNTTAPTTWLTQQIQGRTHQARMGGVTRLYRAFFLRDPDASGLGFWWGRVNGGWNLWRIAEYFSQSPEFLSRYGSLNNGQYVDLVYQNVLGRAPDAGGRAFWMNELNRGARNRGEVMVGFSESAEYVGATKARTDVLITYFGLVRRLPGESEIAFWTTRSNASLVAALFGSVEYHRRF